VCSGSAASDGVELHASTRRPATTVSPSTGATLIRANPEPFVSLPPATNGPVRTLVIE
jgi:hypothetical protein